MNFKINKFLRANLLGFLSGAILLLFSFGCSKADAPPDDGNPGNGNPGNSTTTDDHGNARTSATPATAGTPIAGNIETGDDQDYFSIVVPGASTLRAVTTGTTNTMGNLYDGDGMQLAANDDGGEGMNFNVSAQITSAGTYYIRVTSSGTGMYRLTVTLVSDDHGNTRASATPVMIGTPIAGEIDSGTDIDYFSVDVTSAHLTSIDFLVLRVATTGMIDTMGALYDSDGNELANNDNGGADMNFEISYSITTAGTYYVRVTSAGSGMYSLAVTSMASDHGNNRVGATPVIKGTATTGNIDPGTDEDYFSIEVTSAELSGRDSLILRAGTTGSLDTIGHLYDSDGTPLTMNDDSAPSNSHFNISHKITSAGTYYIRVTSEGSDTGLYSLTVTLEDHGDTRDQATPAMIGTAIDGEIDPGADTDYFSIVVSSPDLTGKDFLVLSAATTGDIDTMGALYDSDGNELATDDNGGEDMNFDTSYNITTAGTYYVRVTSSGTGMYRLTVTTMDGDHSNSAGVTTTPVTSGTAITGNINPGDDADWFSIEVTNSDLAGTDIFTLRAEITTSVAHTMVAIYNSFLDKVAINDNGGTGTNFDVSYQITSTGTYYVAVTNNVSNTGMYSLTVTITGSNYGNTIGSATPITNGVQIDGKISSGTDMDYFSIVVPETSTLKAATTGILDTVGHLYDSSEMQLTTDDNGGADMNFDISYMIMTAGTHYVRVTSSTGTGKYSLTVALDNHGDTSAMATSVTSGAAVTGHISSSDVDYFSIAVPSGGTLTAISTGTTDVRGTLYNTDGTTQLANDDDSALDTNFWLSHQVDCASTSCTYYIRVDGFATGAYTLTVTFIADHGGTQAGATPVTSGLAITGEIGSSTDEDYFSIVVPSTGTLRASTTGMTNTMGDIYASGGTMSLATNDDDGTDMNFDVSHSITTAGTYYVRVTGSGMGEYSLTVEFLPDDDHGDAQADATSVTSGTAVTGHINPGDDEDYFSIVVTGPGILAVETTGSLDTIGHLYDSGGMELAMNDDFYLFPNTNFRLLYRIATAGTYYIKVSSFRSDTGAYSLTATFTP